LSWHYLLLLQKNELAPHFRHIFPPNMYSPRTKHNMVSAIPSEMPVRSSLILPTSFSPYRTIR
jgi:hypothetical protein